jgi:hypothetical protein
MLKNKTNWSEQGCHHSLKDKKNQRDNNIGTHTQYVFILKQHPIFPLPLAFSCFQFGAQKQWKN